MKIFVFLGCMMIIICHAKASDECFQTAGQRYHISPYLLKSIALVESGNSTKSININRDRKGKVISLDYGVMQINDMHFTELRRLGIPTSSKDLLEKKCLNIQIGAWILAQHLRHCGQTWECLGSYNAGFSKKNKLLRNIYARKVYATWLKIRER
ncbi:lytic transglycosylase domain-containing protein [Rosenbergiella collisarenosi]|uniref:lytic transglycosylase domain-containing protein n=1 Tax=Rosenbergiella collisarenosi TaxID=1544695 RepID=UPI001FD61F70|nr:lytic transglycosylase domain-containing protein [Rosenbergiella collisarenosi]